MMAFYDWRYDSTFVVECQRACPRCGSRRWAFIADYGWDSDWPQFCGHDVECDACHYEIGHVGYMETSDEACPLVEGLLKVMGHADSH